MPERFTTNDTKYMTRALELSLRGKRNVSPNPMVGAVAVKNGKIIGQGWHKRFGGKHAEIMALDSCTSSPSGATLYVSLEPCSHYGKTPPCVNAIIARGIRKVIIAVSDPNPLVKGKGIRKLRATGIKVRVGLMKEQARHINESFFCVHEKGRPFVTAKWAMTLDGRIATSKGDSKWISNQRSRQYVHELRADVDAILVGVSTALRDDPRLTVRLGKTVKTQPARIVLDPYLKCSPDALLLEKGESDRVIIATRKDASKKKAATLKLKGVELLSYSCKSEMLPLRKILAHLATRDIQSILVEGGGHVLGNFFKNRLVDKAIAFVAPKLVGGSKALSPLEGWTGIPNIADSFTLKDTRITQFDSDVCIEGYVQYPGDVK